jgi:general secretion pathway protein A
MTVQHQEALSGLVYSVCMRPGLTVLMGEAGTGKTTLLYSIIGLLERRRFCTAMCTNPTLTREEFYDLLMLRFGINCPSTLKSRQLAALEEMLRRNRADGRPSVLIVDEAQRLSPELLEEVRLLLNLETPREKLLQIIVTGQPELGEVLRRPELRQLKQRVSCVCKLEPLTHEDIKDYINHRLARAGLPGQTIFSDTAIDLIYQYTNGIPRLINSLCDTALQTGFALQSPRITPAILEEAASDLDLGRSFEVEASHSEMRSAAVGAASGGGSGPIPLPVNKGKVRSVAAEEVIPEEGYAPRHKSAGFFGSLIDRWR